MSASFCDCVNQWEQVVGLQVLKDTKYLSLRTRGERHVSMSRVTCNMSHYCHVSHLVTLPDGRLPRHGQAHRTLEVLLELLEAGERGSPRHRVVTGTGHDGGCSYGDGNNNTSVLWRSVLTRNTVHFVDVISSLVSETYMTFIHSFVPLLSSFSLYLFLSNIIISCSQPSRPDSSIDFMLNDDI